jgi:hypothetical protein
MLLPSSNNSAIKLLIASGRIDKIFTSVYAILWYGTSTTSLCMPCGHVIGVTWSSLLKKY